MKKNSKPIIGISMMNVYSDREPPHAAVLLDCISAVINAGGMPYLIPSVRMDVTEIFSIVDAIMLTGGADVNPLYYGNYRSNKVTKVDEIRDETEMELLRRALDKNLPILGICRGLQLINIALGGTLVQDLSDAPAAQAALHKTAPKYHHAHKVYVNPSAVLAKILDTTEFDAISWHHQAIDKLAPGLIACAHAEDKVIEAIMMSAYKTWLVGVQWHPEVTASTDETQANLFRSFIAAATTYKSIKN